MELEKIKERIEEIRKRWQERDDYIPISLNCDINELFSLIELLYEKENA